MSTIHLFDGTPALDAPVAARSEGLGLHFRCSGIGTVAGLSSRRIAEGAPVHSPVFYWVGQYVIAPLVYDRLYFDGLFYSRFQFSQRNDAHTPVHEKFTDPGDDEASAWGWDMPEVLVTVQWQLWLFQDEPAVYRFGRVSLPVDRSQLQRVLELWGGEYPVETDTDPVFQALTMWSRRNDRFLLENTRPSANALLTLAIARVDQLVNRVWQSIPCPVRATESSMRRRVRIRSKT